MFDLKGKVAIVTGGASGIGAAAVRIFHQLGASVTIADIQVEAGEAMAAEMGWGSAFRGWTSAPKTIGSAPS